MNQKDLEYWTKWTRNVKDEYKELSNENIKADLKRKSRPFSILCSQIEGDFAFGTIIRTANSFGASKVFYYGNKKYDRRSSLGTHIYTEVIYIGSLEQIKELKSQYRFVALENNLIRKTTLINNYCWHANTLLILGEESCGITSDVLDMCDDFVEIPSIGSVRSLNVGCAGSIAMYDFCTKYELKNNVSP